MVKLPSIFRHHDKEMHALFYFSAAAFLNILFAEKKLSRHIAILIFLFLFGVVIEYGQHFAKKVFHIRHGRPDPVDVQFNLVGLVIFSIFWIAFLVSIRSHKTLDKPAEKHGK